MLNHKTMLFGALALCFAFATGCEDDKDTNPIDWPDPSDECSIPEGSSADDADEDNAPDTCDNCPETPNTDQIDSDHDGMGDACDDDRDNDGTPNAEDNCPQVFHEDQEDSDGDGLGDACDPCPTFPQDQDSDGDGTPDCDDLCPQMAAPSHQDQDNDGVGDACDNCPEMPNTGQVDSDGDGQGDQCDPRGNFTVEEASIDQMHQALLQGETTCEDVVEAYLNRIQYYDLNLSNGAPLNSLVALNQNVREQARALDAMQAETGELSGPLHCVPVVIKDLYLSTDVPTSSGTLALAGTQGKIDGFAVGRIKEAGGLILSSTTMDELSKGIWGVSGRSGKTGNAYNTSKNSGGSSSGSGVAVGSNFAMAGTGTDNCASLIIPGAYNGLVSIRPSVGLISLYGTYPSNSFDAVAGPMTKNVSDLAKMLDAMAGEDLQDPRTTRDNAERPETYTASLKADGLEGKRIGILRTFGREYQDNPEYMHLKSDQDDFRIFNQAIRDMERQGATIVDNVQLDGLNTRRSGGGDFTSQIETFFELVDSPHSNFREQCLSGGHASFAYEDESACLGFQQWAARNSHPESDFYKGVIARYDNNREYTEMVMDILKLDALFFLADSYGSASSGTAHSTCSANSTSGVPTLTFPIGYTNETVTMPVGGVMMGRKYDEETLLEIAYAYENTTHHRRAPARSAAQPPNTLSPLDLERANDLRLRIGQESFDQYFKTGTRFSLSSSRFADLVREVLEEEAPELLP